VKGPVNLGGRRPSPRSVAAGRAEVEEPVAFEQVDPAALGIGLHADSSAISTNTAGSPAKLMN
jgi:hypothetical protein